MSWRGFSVANLLWSGLLGACVASPATIGAVDQASTGSEASGSSSVGEADTSTAESGPGTSTGRLECEPACIAEHACQDARCVDGTCTVSFFDDRCDPGQVCGLEGCEAVPLHCGDPAVLICEGFEDPAYAPQWSDPGVARSDVQVHSGGWAGWVDVAPDARQQLELRLDTPLTDGMLAVRTFVWLPAVDTVEVWSILFEIFGDTEAGSERYSVDLRPQAGLMFVSLLTLEATVLGNDLLVPQTWACVEMRVSLSDGRGEVELRVDDVPVLANGPGIDTIPVDGVSNIQIGGIGAPEHSGPTQYGLDDIVVARAPIGCDVE